MNPFRIPGKWMQLRRPRSPDRDVVGSVVAPGIAEPIHAVHHIALATGRLMI
jgi:hypothetical protein